MKKDVSIVSDEADSLVKFYADFLAAQQELGSEFEKVLYDNLWDLYVRSSRDRILNAVNMVR
jgi:hypothetical protein